MNKFLTSDSIYTVDSQSQLNSFDRKIVSSLYQPIIGYCATSLYFTLWSETDIDRLYSSKSHFNRLLKIMCIDLASIIDCFNILEAIGLIRILYKKEDEIDYYHIMLLSPETANTFFKNPLLVSNLMNALGNDDYIKTKMFFQTNAKDFSSYTDITKKYKDIFSLNHDLRFVRNDEKYKDYSYAKIDGEIDFELLKDYLRPYNLHYSINDKKAKNNIELLLLTYNLSLKDMADSIAECVDENYLDFDLLGKIVKDKAEILKYKTKLELVYLRNNNADNKYEKNSVYDFLKKYCNSIVVNQKMLLDLETIMKEYNINYGICNVLIEYTITNLKGVLRLEYLRMVAQSFKQENINTVEQALRSIDKIKERSAKKENKSNKKVIGSTDDWYKVTNNENETVSDEEAKRMEEILNKLKKR